MPRTRSLLRILVLVVATTMLVGSAAGPASAATMREKKLFQRINKARTKRGIHKLKLDADIVKMAHNHSEKMAEKGYLFHSCLTCKFKGWNWHHLAENVAVAKTIGKAHKKLMKSPGHRANILGKQYKKVGTGVVERKGKLWVTEIFYG